MGKSQQVFLELLRAGLWGTEAHLLAYGEINFEDVYRQAQEQSVVGLVAAGLENVKDVKVQQSIALTMAGEVLQLEQRNRTMNDFVANLIEKLRLEDVYALLVKGQGIAQCYERPLWRACGDVMFVFSHILQHFFKEGIGLRQICDWCRLMWTYRDSLNHGFLESRIKKAGVMTEWNFFYIPCSRLSWNAC